MSQKEENDLYVSKSLTAPGSFTNGVEGPAVDIAGIYML
jgi:hypothetical protein